MTNMTAQNPPEDEHVCLGPDPIVCEQCEAEEAGVSPDNLVLPLTHTKGVNNCPKVIMLQVSRLMNRGREEGVSAKTMITRVAKALDMTEPKAMLVLSIMLNDNF